MTKSEEIYDRLMDSFNKHFRKNYDEITEATTKAAREAVEIEDGLAAFSAGMVFSQQVAKNVLKAVAEELTREAKAKSPV